ncbi:hypothetical protein, partial [Candidatus Darwinibacter acetoxidans]
RDGQPLTAADMGFASGISLECLLDLRGFLRYEGAWLVGRGARFRIHAPGTSDREIIGSPEEAVRAFEEALWEARLLPDEESLSATDHLGLAGGVHPEDVLGLQGFLSYEGAYVEVIREA